MEAETYSNAAVVAYSNNEFVNVELSLDDNPPEAQSFAVQGIPATYLVSPEGERIGEWLGYLGPDAYTRTLKDAVSAHGRLKTLAPKLAEKPDDAKLNGEAAPLYAALGQAERAVAAYRKAAMGTVDAKVQAELLKDALDQALTLPDGRETVLQLAGMLEGVDSDGKLAVRDNASFARGIAAAHEQEFEESIRHFENAVALQPKGDKAPMSLFWLGYLYHEVQQEHDKGIKTLERIVKEFPGTDTAAEAKQMIDHIRQHAGK